VSEGISSMVKKLWLGLAVLPISVLSTQAALAATITLNQTCSFAKAVAWVNTPGTPQGGCTKSGSFGNNDTIIVGLNYQEFTIDSTVEIKKSLTVASWSFYGYLKTTTPSTSTAIKIVAKDISVKFSAIVLQGVSGNTTTGFYVEGASDTNDSFTAKLSLTHSRITGFRYSGIRINQAGVDMYNTTLDNNSNLSGVGGAVRVDSAGTKYGRLNAESCYFDGNTARKGGAIYNHGNVNINGGYFTGNVATKPGGGGTGAVVFAEYFPNNYYTAFSHGTVFEDNRADTNGYAITGGVNTEFAGSTPFTASGNTSGANNPPRLCENPIGQQGCPTQ
jgi:predicted outer membrane repeat protein